MSTHTPPTHTHLHAQVLEFQPDAVDGSLATLYLGALPLRVGWDVLGLTTVNMCVGSVCNAMPPHCAGSWARAAVAGMGLPLPALG